MPYAAAVTRYETMPYRRSGNTGLKLPAISLGLWQNFGGNDPFETQRALLRSAFDQGVTHFDLANNYGPPPGSAELNFAQILHSDFKTHRDELIISTKAGWQMWEGPYGGMTGSRKHLIASCDQSLTRLGLDYVDIFYSHRPDPHTPLEETLGALAQIYRQGKALYIGLSNYGPDLTQKACKIANELKVPLCLSQPNYSLLDRWIEPRLLATNSENGLGTIVFSPLAQGFLSDKYLKTIPDDSRAGRQDWLQKGLTEPKLKLIQALHDIAIGRGQSLAQMALSWTLNDPRVTSTLIGARTVEQLNNSLGALKHLKFKVSELSELDQLTREALPTIFNEPPKATGADMK
jgi:L-glyceraldehyde 3-phosphate reductase